MLFYKTIEQQRIHSETFLNKPFFKHNMSNGLKKARHTQNLFIQGCIVYSLSFSLLGTASAAQTLFFFSSRAAGFGQNKANHIKQTFLGE